MILTVNEDWKNKTVKLKLEFSLHVEAEMEMPKDWQGYTPQGAERFVAPMRAAIENCAAQRAKEQTLDVVVL